MLGIATTDNPHDSPSTDDFAVLTNRFDATTHLHFSAPWQTFVAEHVMIVDLERNDLGKICEYASVKVDDFEILEKYSTVFHLVFNLMFLIL